MPRHPAVDPSPSHWGPLPTLSSVQSDDLTEGLAPWATQDSSTGYAKQQDVSSIPLSQGASPLVFGGGVFGQGMYNNDDFVRSDLPLRILRLAFRYGINCIDTSPYYYPSEFILGRCLHVLKEERPRETYYLCTKAGRYGPNMSEFDYSPERIRRSVGQSLERLGTTYLDLVYLHDAEFVAEQVGEGQADGFAAELASRDTSEGEKTRKSLGLADGDETKIHGPGDEKLLAAVAELFKLKDEGKIRKVGISGYPLPALLRLSRLVASRAPYRPLEAILSYSNHTLHSDILPAYQQLFAKQPTSYLLEDGTPSSSPPSTAAAWTGGPIIFNGSPFSMGLLTDAGPPDWHPASKELKNACNEASQELQAKKDGSSLAIIALTYGIRGAEENSTTSAGEESQPRLRTLLGMSTPDQVHAAIHAYRVLTAGAGPKALCPASSQDEALAEEYKCQCQNEDLVLKKIEKAKALGWSWASPPPDAYD